MNNRKFNLANLIIWVAVVLISLCGITLMVLFLHSDPKDAAIEPGPVESDNQPCAVIVEDVLAPEFDFPVLSFGEPKYIPNQEDVDALARTLYGECRGVPSRMEQAAVAWCVLNRVDAGYADTVLGVVSAPGQFVGYSSYHPVTDELAELAADVLERHWREQQGETDVGRVLPIDYLWFSGRDGHNWFRAKYRSRDYWDWSLPDPYTED